MRRSIKYPALMLALPQAVLFLFYGVMRAVGVPWEVRAGVWGVGAGLALLGTLIGTMICLFDRSRYENSGGWLQSDEEDAARLRQKREEELRRLDAEIGIPRIPVRK